MYRVIYQHHLCHDCGDPNPRQICACGYMREFSERWWIVRRGDPITWSAAGPRPRARGPTEALEHMRNIIELLNEAEGHQDDAASVAVTELIADAADHADDVQLGSIWFR